MRKDIDMNFIPHPMTGDLATKTGDNAVEQSIRNLVLTNFYERGFNVELGGNVTNQLFENIDPLTAETIKSNIKKVIENFEKTVEVIDVVVQNPNPNEITVTILYNINNDPTPKSVSIPLKRLR